MKFRIIGLDLSLSRTGMATIRPHLAEGDRIRLDLIDSAAVTNARYSDTLARIRTICRRIIATIRRDEDPDEIILVMLEGPIFGQSTGQYHTRAGLWWMILHLLEKFAIVVVIEPTKLKRYITGKGNAPKDLVFSTIVRNFPHVGVIDNNEADALGLATMGSRELGFPMEPSVQRVTPDALEGVDWGDFITTQRRNRNG